MSFPKVDIKWDDQQQKILDSINNSIDKFFSISSSLKALFSSKHHEYNGIYLYGGVGRGKTAISRYLCQTIKNLEPGFLHYYELIKDVQGNLHKLRAKAGKRGQREMIKLALDPLVKQYDIICIDEVEVRDITDAMILLRFLEYAKECKKFIIITSNREPGNLYKTGFQKESFEPAIQMLRDDYHIINIGSEIDYRLLKISNKNHITFKVKDHKSSPVTEIYQSFLQGDKPTSYQITVKGREFNFHQTLNKSLNITFDELFKSTISVQDYIEILPHFEIVFCEFIPAFNRDQQDVIIRFINFIDIAYQEKILFFAAFAQELEEMDMGQMNTEFTRTKSRLKEMNSAGYARDHNEKYGKMNV